MICDCSFHHCSEFRKNLDSCTPYETAEWNNIAANIGWNNAHEIFHMVSELIEKLEAQSEKELFPF